MPVETPAAVDRAACPRFIGSGGRSVFVWHHPPGPERRRGAAVVLCPAIGYEYMSAYRTWRLMAESLAELRLAQAASAAQPAQVRGQLPGGPNEVIHALGMLCLIQHDRTSRRCVSSAESGD